ncbi:hypothetical protein NA78x_000091 [Anatilimnocola sp. NA78]|uniref:hypothetical protein n=1 Tax=Anatilimnocola sp. NA78 TaxID=3415683 RepID=UPI003CE5A34F
MSATSSGNPNLPIAGSIAVGPTARMDSVQQLALPPIDSPAMKFAIQACGEVFPGAKFDVEVMNDPDELDYSFYCITVEWPGEVKDCVDRTKRWYNLFDSAHRELLPQFVISVVPV